MPITNTDRKVGEVSALQSISYRHFSLYGDFMEQIEIWKDVARTDSEVGGK